MPLPFEVHQLRQLSLARGPCAQETNNNNNDNNDNNNNDNDNSDTNDDNDNDISSSDNARQYN